jgi:DNA-binding CsgD family transcriptional regulator
VKRTQTLKRDGKGYLYRNLGWFPRDDGQPGTQPKFLLGRDEDQAVERLHRLERLWELVEQHHEPSQPSKPAWDDTTLPIAKAISRGEHTFRLPRQNLPGEDEEDKARADADYAGYLRRMQDAYPVITFIPEDAEAFQNGIRKNIQLAEESQATSDDYARDARQPSVRDMRETLHKAIRAFADAIEGVPKYQSHDTSPGAQPLRAWGYKLKEVCLDFIDRYEDRPMSALTTVDSLQCLYDYWRSRPKRKGTDRAITVKTVKHRLTALDQFLKWLHRTDTFSWRKPVDFDEVDRSVKETKEELASRARPDQVVTFSEEQLISIYQSTTTPLERLLLLLGLNCGCKQAEVGTITLGEVILEACHPYADVLGFHTSDQDSFIKRVRLKTGVYGEFKLWPHTVVGLKWLIERRRRQARVKSGKHAGEPIPIKSSSVLLTTENGLPLYRLYASGNTSQEIPNCWRRIAKRAKIDGGTYSALRRSTANFLRKTYGGEVASVFLQHGSPFERDRLLEEYSNRPYGKLFEALDRWGERLRSMFDSVSDPFPEETRKGGANIPPSKIREIKQLLAEGKKKAEIAKVAGVHRTTVYRYV